MFCLMETIDHRGDFAMQPARKSAEIDLSPDPILAAVENYRGILVDLDRQLKIGPAALASAREHLRQTLVATGLQRGQRVVVALSNGPGFVAALAAILEVGGSPILLHFQTPLAELQRTAIRYGAVSILRDFESNTGSPSASQGRIIDHLWLQLELLPVTAEARSSDESYPALSGVPLHPTSGSTGLPKIAARPGPAAIAEAVNYIDITGIDRHDSILVVTPMSHAYAYGMGVMVPLVSGANMISMRKFALKHVLDALELSDATIFPAVPAILDMLLFGKGSRLLARPRMVLSAGAPLKRRTVENFEQATGRRIHPLYGTTETGGIAVSAEGVTPETADLVGAAMRGVDVRLDDPEDRTLPDRVGRVAIRSTSMMAGYYTPRGIDRSLLHDGWFVTGDLGFVSDQRAIRLIGRESEMINVAGMKVVPGEVEEVLARFPGVVECKVYAGERRSGGQFVKAAVAASGNLDHAQLRAYCEEQLVYYTRPDSIAQLAALPRSPAGKILKDQLP
jgi:acyl-CoA synthetase (AMP-forming)/AMP-acid ligase II